MAEMADAELEIRLRSGAPFDGIVDRLLEQQGSLVKEGDNLTTLSDNSVMWVYFNVPEKRYLEYMAEVGQDRQSPDIELRLANLNKFPVTGKIDPAHNIGAIEAKFKQRDREHRLPRETSRTRSDRRANACCVTARPGTVVISRELKGAIVIPQRATLRDPRQAIRLRRRQGRRGASARDRPSSTNWKTVFVVEKWNGSTGVDVGDQIVLEGIRQVHDGEKVEFEFREPARGDEGSRRTTTPNDDRVAPVPLVTPGTPEPCRRQITRSRACCG